MLRVEPFARVSAGSSAELKVDISGSGGVDACALAVQAARAVLSGPGDACISGKLTTGENIGDLGGLIMAYTAYHQSLGGKEAPVIEVNGVAAWRGLQRVTDFNIAAALVDDLFKLLRLKTTPIGMQLFETVDAMAAAFQASRGGLWPQPAVAARRARRLPMSGVRLG